MEERVGGGVQRQDREAGLGGEEEALRGGRRIHGGLEELDLRPRDLDGAPLGPEGGGEEARADPGGGDPVGVLGVDPDFDLRACIGGDGEGFVVMGELDERAP